LVLQDGAYTISIDPSGKFAYTVEQGQTVVAYSLHSGIFTSLNSTYSGALGSLQLAIDPSGSFVYAPQTGTENDVSGFRINPSGTLSTLPGSPTPSGQAPFSITITSQ
jgi:DNA-binding beta-propeller fold protein YncE